MEEGEQDRVRRVCGEMLEMHAGEMAGRQEGDGRGGILEASTVRRHDTERGGGHDERESCAGEQCY